MKNLDRRPKIVSLFSGAGGLDLGLDAAGFHTVFASDIDQHSCETLIAGREAAKQLKKPILDGAEIVCADVRELNGKEMLRQLGIKKGDLDMVAGGPPCQAFSVFGKRKGKEDPRGMLAWEFIRLLGELQPKTFLFENVFGLVTIGGGAIFDEICAQLSEPCKGLRYNITVFRLNAADYGVPQYRDRVFVCGSRDDFVPGDIEPICTEKPDLLREGLLRVRTVKNGLRGLPKLGSKKVANHTSRKHSERIIKRYAGMRPGERDSHTRINKLDLNRPSFTIIVGSDAGGGKGHIHPIEPREVSPRESARMQTIPDWWTMSGTGRHLIRQVGNAVPSLLGALVGKHVLDTYFDVKSRTYREIIECLSAQHLFSERDLQKLDQLEQFRRKNRGLESRPAKIA